MANSILGRKVGMTQIYDDTGRAIPVTVIEAGPCHVLQIRTIEQDGYEAVQLGFADKPRRLARRSERGHVAKLSSKRVKRRSAAGEEIGAKPNCEPKRFVREFRGTTDGYEIGQEIGVGVLADVKSVDVIAMLSDELILNTIAEERQAELDLNVTLYHDPKSCPNSQRRESSVQSKKVLFFFLQLVGYH